MKPAQLVIYNGNVYYVKHVHTTIATITTLTNYHNIVVGIDIPLIIPYDIHDMWTMIGTDPVAISNYLRTKHPEYFI